MTQYSLEKIKEQMQQITTNVWSTTVGLDLQKTDRSMKPDDIGHALAGCVRISGGWEGGVTLHCSPSLAKRVAHTMFGVEENAATDDDLRDALGELVNMTGGNIKAVLPGPSQLSLPIVAEGKDLTIRVPGNQVVTQITFAWESSLLVVSLLERTGRFTTNNKDGH